MVAEETHLNTADLRYATLIVAASPVLKSLQKNKHNQVSFNASTVTERVYQSVTSFATLAT